MPESQSQVHYAHAVLSGKAKKKGMPKRVAKEIVSKMHGRSMKDLPKHVPKRVRRIRY